MHRMLQKLVYPTSVHQSQGTRVHSTKTYYKFSWKPEARRSERIQTEDVKGF